MGIFKLGPESGSVSPSGGVYISDFENKLIQNGQIFGVSTRFTVAASGTTYIAIDTTNVTSDYVLFLPPFFKAFGAGPLYIDIYEAPTYSGGTTITPINFNFGSELSTGVSIKLAPTVTEVGTKLPNEYSVYSSYEGLGSGAARTGGEASFGNLIYDIPIGTKWLFSITNQDDTYAAEGTFATDWAEL